MRQKSNESILKPALILTAICLITALALALTNELTKEPIKAEKLRRENASRSIVLPGAESFEEKEFTPEDGEGATFTYYEGLDSAGKVIGYIFSNETQGYGGPVKVNMGVNTEGEITGVMPLELLESAGIGTKVQEDDFLSRFEGKIGPLKITKPAVENNEVEAISGATVSSGAFINSVNSGYEQFATLTGLGSAQADERMLAFPGAVAFTEEIPAENADGAYTYFEAFDDTNEVIGYVFKNGTPGYYDDKDVVVLLGIDLEGKVVGNIPVDLQETPGLGSRVEEDEFRNQFNGQTGPFEIGANVDAVSAATKSSDGYVASVNKGVKQFEEVKGKISGLPAIPAGEEAKKTPEQLAMPEAKSFSEVLSATAEGGAFEYKEALDADGKVIGYLFFPVEKGYHGDIKSVIGVNLEGKVSGANIIEHTETAGLGSRIEEEEFLSQFAGLSLADEVNSADAITNATVSSKAYFATVVQALEQFEAVKGGN